MGISLIYSISIALGEHMFEHFVNLTVDIPLPSSPAPDKTPKLHSSRSFLFLHHLVFPFTAKSVDTAVEVSCFDLAFYFKVTGVSVSNSSL